MDQVIQSGGFGLPSTKESKMEVKHNIKMNLTELHYTLEGIDAVIGRPIDENGKDILFQARKQIAKFFTKRSWSYQQRKNIKTRLQGKNL